MTKWGSFSSVPSLYTWIWSFPGLTIHIKRTPTPLLSCKCLYPVLLNCQKKLFHFLVYEDPFFHFVWNTSLFEHFFLLSVKSNFCQSYCISLSPSLSSSIDHFPLHILSILGIDEGQMEIVKFYEPSKEQ